MSEWRLQNLDECVDVLDHLRVPVNEEARSNNPGNIPYYGANGLQGYIDGWIFEEPLILMAEDGGYFDEFSTRPIAYKISGKSWVNNHAHVLRPKGEYDFDFLFYSLQHKNVLPFIKGGTRAKLNQRELREIKLYVPVQQRVQKAISRILETIDEAIEKTEALIHKYQQIKTGLMHDLFTRGLTADGKIRPPREQAPELYQKTPIGWIPKEWKIWGFEKVAQILDPQPDHRTPPEQRDGIPYIGIGDFDLNGELDTNGCRKIIPGAYKKQRQRFTAESGDIIFGKIGTIGHPKILPSGRYALSANVLLIKSTICSNYMFHILNAAFFDKQISDITNTTSQPALGIEKVRDLLIPLPSDDKELNKISALLDSCYMNISNNFIYLQKLKKQKSGLMHDLLTGKVPVTIDPAETAHV